MQITKKKKNHKVTQRTNYASWSFFLPIEFVAL